MKNEPKFVNILDSSDALLEATERARRLLLLEMSYNIPETKKSLIKSIVETLEETFDTLVKEDLIVAAE